MKSLTVSSLHTVYLPQSTDKFIFKLYFFYDICHNFFFKLKKSLIMLCVHIFEKLLCLYISLLDFLNIINGIRYNMIYWCLVTTMAKEQALCCFEKCGTHLQSVLCASFSFSVLQQTSWMIFQPLFPFSLSEHHHQHY